MKTDRRLRFLLLELLMVLLLGTGYFAADRIGSERGEGAEEALSDDSSLFPFSEERIAGICFPGDGGTITLEKRNGEWICESDPDFVMAADKADKLTRDLAGLTAERILQDAGDPEAYGLGAGAGEIRAWREDGAECRLRIGNRNDANGELYVQLYPPQEGPPQEDRQQEDLQQENNGQEAAQEQGPGGSGEGTVFLTKTPLDRDFSGSLKDFAAYEEVPRITPSRIRRIEVRKGEDSYKLETPGDNHCTVTGADGRTESADVSIVGGVQSRLGNLSWLADLEYACKDFAAYGLAEPDATITIVCEDRDPVVLAVSDQEGEDGCYVRLADSPQVHTVRREYLQDLVQGKAEDFWSLSYSFVSIGDLERLTVGYNQQESILYTEEGEGETRYYLNGKTVDKERFTGFYYACVSVTAQERLPKVPDLKEEPVLTLRYELKDGSRKEIRYYETDQNFVTAVYDDGTKAALVNRLYVKEMLDSLGKLTA